MKVDDSIRRRFRLLNEHGIGTNELEMIFDCADRFEREAFKNHYEEYLEEESARKEDEAYDNFRMFATLFRKVHETDDFEKSVKMAAISFAKIFTNLNSLSDIESIVERYMNENDEAEGGAQ